MIGGVVLGMVIVGVLVVVVDVLVSIVVGSVVVVNDYLFCGLLQINWKLVVQLGIEYDYVSGWYVGVWGSNISWLFDVFIDVVYIFFSVELDFYIGYCGSFVGDVSYDFGIYEYYYLGSYLMGFIWLYIIEVYGVLGYKGVILKYLYVFINLFGFIDFKYFGYVDFFYNVEFSFGWMLNLYVGYQKVQYVVGVFYSDWKVGVIKVFDYGYLVLLGYYDINVLCSVYINVDGYFVGCVIGIFMLVKVF